MSKAEKLSDLRWEVLGQITKRLGVASDARFLAECAVRTAHEALEIAQQAEESIRGEINAATERFRLDLAAEQEEAPQ